MSESPTGWSGDTRAEGASPKPSPPDPATRADASAALTGRPLTALQGLARRFEILGELGRGGMGVVYRARDREAGREVAIKLLLALPSEVRLQRFEREGATAARLRHKGIVAVHSAGQSEGQPYLVCELVPDARPFDEACEALPLEARLRLLREVIDAMAYAHGEGVIHRDLKPANVIVDAEGHPRVTDFGLARHEGDDRLTRTGASLGTPTHMAPEQGRGERDRVGPPADVWSLGIMLHEVVCGSPPFSDQAATPLEAYLMLQNLDAPGLRARGAKVSAQLDALARRALARDPQERFPDAGALRDALDEVLATGVEARARWALPFAALAGALALALAIALSLPRDDSRTPGVEPTSSALAGPAGSTPSPSLEPQPSIPADQLLARLEAVPSELERTLAAWDWLRATPRAAGHERVRALIRRVDRPLRTRDLPGADQLAFLADGRLLVVTRDGEGLLWDPLSDAAEATPSFESGCASVTVSPDRTRYAVLGNIRIAATVFPGAHRVTLPLKAGGIALADNGDLVVGQLGGGVQLIRSETDSPRATFQAHDARIYLLRPLPRGELITASRTRLTAEGARPKDSLRYWSDKQTLLWELPLKRRADSLSLDASGRLLLIKCSGGLIARYDLQERSGPSFFKGEESHDRQLRAPRAHAGEVVDVKIDPSGHYAYSTAWPEATPLQTELRVWDARQGLLLETRRRGHGRYGASDVSPDGRWFATIHALTKTEQRVEVWAALPPP